MAEPAELQRAVQTAISQTLTSSQEAIRAQVKELVTAVAALGESTRGGSSPESVVAAIPALMQAQAKAAAVCASLEVLSRFLGMAVQMSAAPVVAVPAPVVAPPPKVAEAPVEIPAGVSAETYEPPAAIKEVPAPPAAVEEVPAAVEEPAAPAPVAAAPPPVAEVREPEPAVAAAPAVEAPPAEFDIESLPPEKRDLHKKAKRFARVTVQDIISYKPKEVELGRQKKDLYQRFQEEIDRGRQMYEKRFGEIADSNVDYFYEELVRVLAENDPAALGKYPYPVPSLRLS